MKKYIIFFIIIVSFLNISLKAEDYNFKNYTLNEFIDKSNSDLEKASSIKDFQNFLRKYDFSKVPKKFHQDASTLNILASEFLVWRNQKVDINKFMQFLSKKIKSQNFSEQDILRFLILNETKFFNIETKIVTTFSNTENGKIFLCLVKEDDCQNKNLLKLFKDEFLFSNSILSLHVFDKTKAKLIWGRVFKNIIKSKHILIDDKIKIFAHFNTRLNSIFRGFTSQEFMALSNYLTDEEIKILLQNKNIFNQYKDLALESILRDNEKLLKTTNFNESYIFYDNKINNFLKNNVSEFNQIYILEYLNEIYQLDPQRLFNPKSWYEIIKILERKAYSTQGEGSELHLKFLDKLINIASETDTQLKDGYVKYALEIYKKEKNDSVNLKTLDNIYENYLKKNNNFDDLILFYKNKLKIKKNNLEKINLKNRPEISNYFKISSIVGVCQTTLSLSQHYVQQGNGDLAKQIMLDHCSPFLPELINYSKQMAIPYIFQQYFMSVVENLVKNKNNFIDFKLINKLAYDESIIFSSRMKMLIILTLSEKIKFSEFNKIYVEEVSKIANDDELIQDIANRKFILKLSENLLMNLSDDASGIDYQSFFDLKNNLIKLLTIQLLTDAKTNSFSDSYRSYRGLDDQNKIMKNLISFFKGNKKNKNISLLTQLIIYEYLFEKDKTKIKNSNLLRLLILSKFSNSESYINYQAIIKKENKHKYREYFERRKRLLLLSSNNLNDNKDISKDIVKFIDESILSEKYYEISNQEYLDKIFDFNKPLVEEIQNNLSSNQVYLNFFEIKDINKLLIYGISKNDVKIKLIDDLKSINNEIIDYNKAINGQLTNYSLNRVFKLQQKILPLSIFKNNIDEIRISADGIFYKLPFGALILKETNAVLNPPIYMASRGISKQNSQTEKSSGLDSILWLNHVYNVTYVPSIIKFKNKKNRLTKKFKFLGIGDPKFKSSKLTYEGKNINLEKLVPLPSTREEIKMISDLFKKNDRKILIGENASEEIFKKQLLDKFNIIVFATHGFMTSELSPVSEPGLALSNFGSQNTEDGYLSSSEIISLNLEADWVLLTACNTFNTKDSDQNPFAGLASSFLSAGSDGVMSTLWPIETNSAKNFSISAVKKFKNDGFSRSQSLQKAQHELRKSKNLQWLHPFYWAPYVNIESTIN